MPSDEPTAASSAPGSGHTAESSAASPSEAPARGRPVRRIAGQVGRWVLLVAVVLVVVAGVGAVAAVRTSAPTVDGRLPLAGLTSEVTVTRDASGVPTIVADTSADLFRAQGYVHAQDRFWEMDFRRHMTAGRLSEMFGAGQVETDSVIRAMGWRRVATAEWRLLNPTSRNYLTAYAAGVNAYLAERSGLTASLEYGIVALTAPNYRIEPWTPIDSLAWLKAMAWDLRSNLPDELGRARLRSGGMSTERVNQLWPTYPYDRHTPIVPPPPGTPPPPASRPAGAGTPAPAQPDAGQPGRTGRPVADTPVGSTSGAGLPRSASGPGASQSGDSRSGDSRSGDSRSGDSGSAAAVSGASAGPALAATSRALRALPGAGIDGSGAGIGSNSWVLSGSRTQSGKPLLANDPHLGASMPAIWYQVGLRCRRVSAACPFTVTGFSFSGLPGVVIGATDRIGWGFTNLAPDVADLYMEDIRGDSYRVGNQWRRLTTRREVIKVADGSSRTITVRSTGHGPLMSDVDKGMRAAGSRYAVAMRWTALDPGRSMDSVFAMNQARSWPEFKAAASLFAVPAQNMVYADATGAIGYQAPGRIPTRKRGDGAWPAPGWDPSYDWTGWIPFDQMPSVLNPPEGLVVTANQAVIGPEYPYPMTRDWGGGYRSQRIRELLRAGGKKLTASDMSRMQMDDRNQNAADLTPTLLGVRTTGKTSDAQALLRGWDFRQGVDSAPAAFFNATWRQLLAGTFYDEIRPADRELVKGGEQWFLVMRSLINQPNSPWWDDRRTPRVERRDDILGKAMTEAAGQLAADQGAEPANWRWGAMHRLELRNASLGESGIAPVEWLFNRGPYEVSGGGGLVNATSWGASEGFDVKALPSMRMVVDFANLDRSRWINLTGASGHAFDPHYADQASKWQRGETTPMPFSPAAVRAATRHTLTLTP